MATDRLTAVEPVAIVLTGGLSTRMGVDKASLVVNGTPMVEHVIGQLTRAGIHVIAVAGSDDVPDPDPGQGPMAGIVAGWRHLHARHPGDLDIIVVLSCDLPRLDVSVITRLVQCAPVHSHGAVAHDGSRPQPLIAAYRVPALVQFDAEYEAGTRSVRAMFDDWDLGQVEMAAEVLADADRPEDLEGFDVSWPL